MNKKITISVLALAVVAIIATSWSTVAAANSTNRASVIEKIASKFNLNKDEVQKVFDEMRSEHQAARKTELSTNLDKAVKDGVITADQKQKILEKMAQNQNRADKQRGEMRQWAIDSGIDLEKLADYGLLRKGQGRGDRPGKN